MHLHEEAIDVRRLHEFRQYYCGVSKFKTPVFIFSKYPLEHENYKIFSHYVKNVVKS